MADEGWRYSCVSCWTFGAVSLLPTFACTPTEAPRVLQARTTRGDAGELPGPAPRGRGPDEAHALNARCEACHREIAQEWRASLHAQAHTDAVYQRAFAIEPLAFCQGCHAPEANPSEPVPQIAAELGVACVTCHVLGRDVAGAARSEETPRGARTAAAPHAVLRDGRLDGTIACAACHEFEFPDRAGRVRAELMQSTVSEHARSSARHQACADCHMPLVERDGRSHRSHRFAGGRDAELVRSAVSVAATRETPSSVRVALVPRALGHAFPTGDLFRRLEVSAEALGPEFQVVASGQRYLARHWERDRKRPFGVVLRSAVSDDRPLAERLEIVLELGAQAADFPIAWRVAYQRVEHPRSTDEEESLVEGEIELSSGTLPKPP